jgi:hypothetical protein
MNEFAGRVPNAPPTDRRHKRRVPQDEIDTMINMRKGGMSYAAIGAVFGRSAVAIYGTINPKRRSQYARTYYRKHLAKKRATNDH